MLTRRDAISQIALMLGGAITAPTLMAMEAKHLGKPALAESFSLSDTQRKIVAAVAEHIIPKTSTPGAIEAGVPAFIELMLNDCYKLPEQRSFLKGVSDLDKAGFLSQNSNGQIAMLKLLETNTKDLMKSYRVNLQKVGDNVDKETLEGNTGVPFWRLIKELTLLGYFTSEKGITSSFEYVTVPGKFEPTKLKPGQKAYQY